MVYKCQCHIDIKEKGILYSSHYCIAFNLGLDL